MKLWAIYRTSPNGFPMFCLRAFDVTVHGAQEIDYRLGFRALQEAQEFVRKDGAEQIAIREDDETADLVELWR
jgi:hypothetical protein